MRAYDSDPRVTEVDACQYRVSSGGQQWDVHRSPGGWCGEWVDGGWWYTDGNARLEFGTADEAIRSLIGDPQ